MKILFSLLYRYLAKIQAFHIGIERNKKKGYLPILLFSIHATIQHLKNKGNKMKKIILSTVAVAAISTFAIAGGDIAVVEEPMVEVEEAPVATDAGLYLGLGYSYTMGTQDIAGINMIDKDYSSVMLQAGYKFNSYVAVEGRYAFGLDRSVDYLGTSFDQSIDSWGLYVKPMYPVTDKMDVYALLGYASSKYNNTTDMPTNTMDGFSWGLGASYSVADNVDLFVDYVSLYNDNSSYGAGPVSYDDKIQTVNFGVTYNF